MHRSGVAMAWNVFRFCTALRGLGSIMIVLVLAIVGVTYYAVVVANYGPALLAAGGPAAALAALLVLLLFHLLLVMLLWSYFSVVFTDPGGVPPHWQPDVDEESGSVQLTSSDFNSPILSLQQSATLTDSGNPRIRYCRKCNQLKPPRCHHCSVCGRCVLKMDHHCVWVVNCVGALNYKFFLLFLDDCSRPQLVKVRASLVTVCKEAGEEADHGLLSKGRDSTPQASRVTTVGWR